MSRHMVQLHMRPVPEPFAKVYRRRGLAVPTLSSSYPIAALWPYKYRRLHELYAFTHGYFWMPCILCGRDFGGHEIGANIPDPTRGNGAGITICPVCTAERHGGEV